MTRLIPHDSDATLFFAAPTRRRPPGAPNNLPAGSLIDNSELSADSEGYVFSIPTLPPPHL